MVKHKLDVHGLPVEASFVRDASPMRKLSKIDFVGELFKSRVEFVKRRGILR